MRDGCKWMGRPDGDQGLHARNLHRSGMIRTGNAHLVWSKHEVCILEPGKRRSDHVCYTQDDGTSRTSQTITEIIGLPCAGVVRSQRSAHALERVWYPRYQ